jgi:uncharacterized tellurite resistance protein B-like protein
MLDAIRRFFQSSMLPPETAPPETRDRDLRLAACALLLELAHADDEFTDDERAHLAGAVRRHFGLDQQQAEDLLQHAERARRSAPDLWRFTNLIREHYSLGQKMVLAEIMWGLVYSDGELSAREDYLMRRVSKLLDLDMPYLSEARKRAESGLDDERPPID